MKFDKGVELLAGETVKLRKLSYGELAIPIPSSMRRSLPSFFNRRELQLWVYDYNGEVHVEIGSPDRSVSTETLRGQKRKMELLEKEVKETRERIATYKAKTASLSKELEDEKEELARQSDIIHLVAQGKVMIVTAPAKSRKR